MCDRTNVISRLTFWGARVDWRVNSNIIEVSTLRRNSLMCGKERHAKKWTFPIIHWKVINLIKSSTMLNVDKSLYEGGNIEICYTVIYWVGLLYSSGIYLVRSIQILHPLQRFTGKWFTRYAKAIFLLTSSITNALLHVKKYSVHWIPKQR